MMASNTIERSTDKTITGTSFESPPSPSVLSLKQYMYLSSNEAPSPKNVNSLLKTSNIFELYLFTLYKQPLNNKMLYFLQQFDYECVSILNFIVYSNNLLYRPFHKTLPRSSASVNRISARFYETDCMKICTFCLKRFIDVSYLKCFLICPKKNANHVGTINYYLGRLKVIAPKINLFFEI